ncbi:histidine kinase [Amycolatopsis rhabdoformis]|uniref:histidine kinase n=1 Tax=Amycolatopsis rhabdoformis TaxID=1448059 RepID=A0ABZ1I2L6_9PSEU|nr:histidine kinase [Amycolatopsis rhabdoformis]WSE27895.1 histidine kinase [Amycolatopsis rhabdoformis]
MRDISSSLARQALLVALVCLICDVALFSLRGPLPEAGWRGWVVLAGAVIVDAALAGAARYSGWVAGAHAVLFAAAPLLLCTCTGFVVGNNAGILVAGYRAGAWLRTGPAVVALVAMLAGVGAGELWGGGRGSNPALIAISMAVSAVLPWLVGRYTTARGAYIAYLGREADERRRHEAEAVRRAVQEERETIARDLHDVISHHVSAIGVHAGAARLGLPQGEPEGALHKSLGAVESASRSAMADLRRLLDLLHARGDEAAQPGLDNLDELLDTVRAAGLPVRLTVHGDVREIPGSLDVALYRIAQEALTNALRHGTGPVEIELDHRRTEIVLTVTNEAGRPDPQRDGAHRGLAGIRQRVTLFGGEVTYGRRDDTWQVKASFPLEVA